jgi:hypothetical protein
MNLFVFIKRYDRMSCMEYQTSKYDLNDGK